VRSPTTAEAYCDALGGVAGELPLERHAVTHGEKTYPLPRLASPEQGGPLLLISAGFHGDERAGPLSILEHLEEIVSYARERGVGLILYPLCNPSGFEAGTRYNIEGDRGELGNNDFLRYELADGRIVGDVGRGRPFTRWRWSSDPALGARLPAETARLHALLRREPLEHVAAAVDLHQDHFTTVDRPLSYGYAFGDLSRYAPILAVVGREIALARHLSVCAGQPDATTTDGAGLIVRHDGTLPDLFHRLGARHGVTVETTGNTPLGLACRVNLIWIRGVIELLSR